jgi:hypothetical protein
VPSVWDSNAMNVRSCHSPSDLQGSALFLFGVFTLLLGLGIALLCLSIPNIMETAMAYMTH